MVEISALFEVLYMRGALWKKMMDINTVFYHETADPTFSSAFKRKGLSFLCTIIQLENSRLRKEPRSTDKFPALWDFFERCNRKFIKLRIPSHSCATDEHSIGTDGESRSNNTNPASLQSMVCSGVLY